MRENFHDANFSNFMNDITFANIEHFFKPISRDGSSSSKDESP